jgi:hypothetical protein
MIKSFLMEQGQNTHSLHDGGMMAPFVDRQLSQRPNTDIFKEVSQDKTHELYDQINIC